MNVTSLLVMWDVPHSYRAFLGFRQHICILLLSQMCAVEDVAHAYRAFLGFFSTIGELDRTVDPDTLPPPHILGTLQDTPCQHAHA